MKQPYSELEAERDELEAKVSRLIGERDEAREQLTTSIGTIVKLTGDLRAMTKERDLLREDRDRLYRQRNELENQCATHNEALVELERAGWPCRLVELPALYIDVATQYQALKGKVSKP